MDIKIEHNGTKIEINEIQDHGVTRYDQYSTCLKETIRVMCELVLKLQENNIK